MSDQEDIEKRKKVEEASHPIDNAYAWVILTASLFSNFHVVGTYKIFGILYAEFIREYNASALSASFLQLTQPIVYSLSSIFILTVGMSVLTCRQGAIIGGLLLFLSFSLSSFATNIYVLIFTYSFLQGVGTAFAYTSSVVIVSLYFNKRRGMANGLLTASGSLGGLVLVPLMRTLIEEYRLSGALLIFSAICCHNIVAGFLFRPLSFYKRNDERHRKEDTKYNSLSDEHSDTKRKLLIKEQCTGEGKETSMYTSEPILHDISFELSWKGINEVTRDRSNSERHHVAFANKNALEHETSHTKHTINLYLPGGHFQSLQSINICIDQNEKEAYIKDHNMDQSQTKSAILAKYLNFRILKNKAFLRLMITYAFGSIGALLPLYYIAIYVQERNIDVQKSDMLVVVAGASEVVGRGLPGYISDRISIKRQYIIAIGLTLSAIAHSFIQVYSNYWSLVLYSIIYGMCGAVLSGMYASTLVDILGLHNFNSALCLMWLLQGITSGAASPIVGLIRDETGSYVPCFYFFSVTLVVAASFMWVELLPCLTSNVEERNHTIKR